MAKTSSRPLHRIIAISNQKGGVGKTTTAINLAASLAVLGYRVLLVDMDPQGNCSSGVGAPRNERRDSIYHVLLGIKPAGDIITRTEIPRLHLLESSRDLVGAEVELASVSGREFRLKKAVGALGPQYDFIVVDCPPSLGLLTVNALVAANSVLIPMQCEYFAMEGLGDLVHTLKLVKQRLNPSLEREGILLTMFDKRNRLSRQVSLEVRSMFGGLVFEVTIPRNVRLSEAPSFGMPAFRYAVRSAGAQAYMALAHEVVRRNARGRTVGEVAR